MSQRVEVFVIPQKHVVPFPFRLTLLSSPLQRKLKHYNETKRVSGTSRGSSARITVTCSFPFLPLPRFSPFHPSPYFPPFSFSPFLHFFPFFFSPPRLCIAFVSYFDTQSSFFTRPVSHEGMFSVRLCR